MLPHTQKKKFQHRICGILEALVEAGEAFTGESTGPGNRNSGVIIDREHA